MSRVRRTKGISAAVRRGTGLAILAAVAFLSEQNHIVWADEMVPTEDAITDRHLAARPDTSAGGTLFQWDASNWAGASVGATDSKFKIRVSTTALAGWDGGWVPDAAPRGQPGVLEAGMPPIPDETAGTVSRLIPQALDRHLRSTGEIPLNVADNVSWQDVVRTLGAGRLRLQLLDGSFVNIGARSTMRIVKHDPQTQQTQLEMALGRMRGEVVKLTKPNASFQVKTGTAVIGVVGTIFLVDARTRCTDVCDVQGVVTVRNANPSVAGEKTLFPGQCARVCDSEPTEPANPAQLISRLTKLTDVPESLSPEFAEGGNIGEVILLVPFFVVPVLPSPSPQTSQTPPKPKPRPSVVPEPGSLLLVTTGLACGLAWLAYRNKLNKRSTIRSARKCYPRQ